MRSIFSSSVIDLTVSIISEIPFRSLMLLSNMVTVDSVFGKSKEILEDKFLFLNMQDCQKLRGFGLKNARKPKIIEMNQVDIINIPDFSLSTRAR